MIDQFPLHPRRAMRVPAVVVSDCFVLVSNAKWDLALHAYTNVGEWVNDDKDGRAWTKGVPFTHSTCTPCLFISCEFGFGFLPPTYGQITCWYDVRRKFY